MSCVHPTADVTLPEGEIILAAKDDTAEYDDGESSLNYKDDKKYVFWNCIYKLLYLIYLLVFIYFFFQYNSFSKG